MYRVNAILLLASQRVFNMLFIHNKSIGSDPNIKSPKSNIHMTRRKSNPCSFLQPVQVSNVILSLSLCMSLLLRTRVHAMSTTATTTTSRPPFHIVVHWFRLGDLRVHDNPALVHSRYVYAYMHVQAVMHNCTKPRCLLTVDSTTSTNFDTSTVSVFKTHYASYFITLSPTTLLLLSTANWVGIVSFHFSVLILPFLVLQPGRPWIH
jgi:hypothetical protein